MLKIGLTGGIGSGKTTVAKIFSSLNIPVIDSDIIAHQLVLPGSECFKKIVGLFGDEFLATNGELDRKKMAQYIFSHEDKKTDLENILHPQIKAKMLEEIQKLEESPYVILAIPLLFETDFIDLVDRVLVVDVPEKIQIERIKNRDSLSEEQAKKIIDNQIDQTTRAKKADDILDNSASIEDIQPAIRHLHDTYLNLSNNNHYT
jgi:dephospho-CoA kinase